jgi:hypothetical protein
VFEIAPSHGVGGRVISIAHVLFSLYKFFD